MLVVAYSDELLLTLALVLLALSSLNLVTLSALRLFLRPRTLPAALPPETELPDVLIQLPAYNEGDLIARILATVAALDWPREHLFVQVLDDSTDGSLASSRQAVREWQARGLQVELLHRTRRTAFKAGALAAGLQHSQAPYVAIFDVDFLPPRDFLRRTIGVLHANPRRGYVQARWGHQNRSESLLTHAQARLLDSHFQVEQEARWRAGLPLPFNGTCGVWRRAAIEDAGGWQGDTLTEDLDLSLRAVLHGWQPAYLRDLVVPGELPVSSRAWRGQQFRWTKGFVQCFIKLMPMIWQSRNLSLAKKVLLSLELGQPLAFPIGAACILLSLPLMAGDITEAGILAPVALVASVLGFTAPMLFLTLAGRARTHRETAFEVLSAFVLTSGLLISNTRASFEALIGLRSEFVRTPKTVQSAAPRLSAWRRGLPELALAFALLGFALMEEPVAIVYLALLIGGLIGVGVLQFYDEPRLVEKRLGTLKEGLVRMLG